MPAKHSRAGRQPSSELSLDWNELLDKALTLPGNVGNAYSRFYNYSYLNKLLLAIQGVQGPVATYKGWQELGRHVVKGAKAKEIVRPIFIEKKNDAGEVEEVIKRYKPVRCIFDYQDTEGEELPPAPTPGWDYQKALGALSIREVPFDELNGNVHGFSRGQELAINPMATNPNKTRFHELAHIVLGHTVEPLAADYVSHRGLYEFQAEATAYLCLNELDMLDEQTAEQSRGYIQSWLQGERPSETAIRSVFTATDRILSAGHVAVESLIDLEQHAAKEAPGM